jgi:radical SAM protein with 4Fe4S-binding SPASM domain
VVQAVSSLQGSQGICRTSGEHMERLRRRAVAQHIPLSGSFDITHRCNLRCIHCYLGWHENDEQRQPKELDKKQISLLIEQAVEAGCLYLLISGGEPLLRPDFDDIYRHSRSLGTWVTVFTNATLISERHIDLFREYPPHLVEVSLYGAREDTYESITRAKGSYSRCLSGIKLMIQAGIRVGLKTMVLQSNVHEIEAIEEMANCLGTPFRLDAAIIPCLDREKSPLLERVEPSKVVKLEFRSSKRRNQYEEYYRRTLTYPLTDKLFHCGAGVTAFHIDPEGILRPCFMTPDLAKRPLDTGFIEAWAGAVAAISGLRSNPEKMCHACHKKSICGYCPGLFFIENGDMESPPSYLCDLGEARLSLLQPIVDSGGNANAI